MKEIGTGYNSVPICGVFTENEATQWLGSLVDDSLHENIIIADYGCGNGRLSNYISKRINDFKYIGIEIDSKHGKDMIIFAEKNFTDERTSFGLVGSDVEKEAIESAQVVIYGSVFTHTTIEDTYDILDRYAPVLSHGGKLVFSALIKPQYIIGNNKAYYDDGYNVVYNTLGQYMDYAKDNNLSLRSVGEWNGGPTQHHTIFELWENK